MKKILVFFCAIVLLFPQMLFASENNTLPSEMEQFYLENGATQAEVEVLAENYSNGVLPESGNPNAIPSEILTNTDEYGNKTTTYYYSDGSVTIFSVTGGNCGSNGYSSWCTGAKVSVDGGLYYAEFYADYSMSSVDYEISAAYNEHVRSKDPYVGIGNVNLTINVPVSTTKAYATLYWTSNATSEQLYLRLNVDSSGAYSTAVLS